MATDQGSAPNFGFRNSPTSVTVPCLGYMSRITELRTFVGLLFDMIKRGRVLGAFADELLGDERIELVRRKKIQELGEGIEVLRYDYAWHRQLVNEIMLARAIESFDLYLIRILKIVMTARPDVLKSGGQISARAVLELGSPAEIVSFLAEKKINELAYRPLSALVEYIDDELGLELFGSKEAYHTVLVATEVRNLIAHNDCCVNETFERRTRGVSVEIEPTSDGKLILTDEWLRRSSYGLDGVVFDFDEQVASKYNLERQPPALARPGERPPF